MPHIERVESLARTPFPQAGPSAADKELTLDSLEAKPDPLQDDSDMMSALSDVVASAPELFPLGLASLSERAAGMRNLAPLITSDKPDQAEIDALKQAVEKMPILRGRLISKDGRLAWWSRWPSTMR